MTDIEYSSDICDRMRVRVEKKIETLQKKMKDIQLFEDLHHFGDLGEFNRSFVENAFANWSEYSNDVEANKYVEDRLARLPFESAYCYKNPDFYTKSRTDILEHVFNDTVDWRDNPGFVENKSRAIKRFEYMCYYVINTRDELLFDLNDDLLQ